MLNRALAYSNDLWMFNLTTGRWAWVGGSNITNQAGRYGSLGMESNVNLPGVRSSFSMLFDSSSRALYVFGGSGLGASGSYGTHCMIFLCYLFNNKYRWDE